MNAEFFDAIAQIEREKGIPRTFMHEKISQALVTAYKRDNAGISENIVVELDDTRKEVHMYLQKTVVEEVTNPALELSREQAREISPTSDVGDVVPIPVETRNFGRIAAQTAKQVIIQGIREAEHGLVYQEFNSKEHEILSAQVSRFDVRNGGVVMEIGGSKGDKTEAILMPGEQIREEMLNIGDRVKVYVVEVRKSSRGPLILISRTHPGLVRRLFELEIPEIHDGVVEIRSIAREAGHRTKIAISSNDANVDPIGACIGPRGARVGGIVEELRGEKIDIIKYNDDPVEFVTASMALADVVHAEILDDGKSCRVVVPDDQLSLAIGKEGQNARLAAKLTGFKIDIRSKSQWEAETAAQQA
ncbi:MAG: transcription termination factor NusA [Oscillospiraceae bacterium]|jgi:N utilization substance protein A|nr:transcription termination factor NusA [Oscillospiraceae bacterium]